MLGLISFKNLISYNHNYLTKNANYMELELAFRKANELELDKNSQLIVIRNR